jgi:hypothetical protein
MIHVFVAVCQGHIELAVSSCRQHASILTAHRDPEKTQTSLQPPSISWRVRPYGDAAALLRMSDLLSEDSDCPINLEAVFS